MKYINLLKQLVGPYNNALVSLPYIVKLKMINKFRKICPTYETPKIIRSGLEIPLKDEGEIVSSQCTDFKVGVNGPGKYKMSSRACKDFSLGKGFLCGKLLNCWHWD